MTPATGPASAVTTLSSGASAATIWASAATVRTTPFAIRTTTRFRIAARRAALNPQVRQFLIQGFPVFLAQVTHIYVAQSDRFAGRRVRHLHAPSKRAACGATVDALIGQLVSQSVFVFVAKRCRVNLGQRDGLTTDRVND